MLEVVDLCCGYGAVPVLKDASFTVRSGEVVCLMGRNGAGKTTALKTIMGLVRPTGGRVLLDGLEVSHLPAHEVPRQGIGYVPQGRRLFAELSVRENLTIGLMTRRTGSAALDKAVSLFPVLKERMNQRSGTLSGGEQQMLAIARALCLEPKALLLDEPTEGLMPSMIAAIRQSVLDLKAHDVAILLVEQRADAVLPVADRIAFMETGRVREVLPVEAIRADHHLIDRYVGVGV